MVILTNSIFNIFTEYFYNILTQDKTYFDTDIITLPNVRVKRLAEFKNVSLIFI